MPRTPNDPLEIVTPRQQKTVRFDPQLEGASFSRHTKPIKPPSSPLSPLWLQMAQQIVHMPPLQRKAVGRAQMKQLCTNALEAMHAHKVRGKGYEKLKQELLRIRKVWG